MFSGALTSVEGQFPKRVLGWDHVLLEGDDGLSLHGGLMVSCALLHRRDSTPVGSYEMGSLALS